MIYSPHQEPEEKKAGKIYLINPSVKEFKTTYFDNNNVSVEVTMAPLETRAFPFEVGQVVLKHLVNFILNQGGFSYKTDVNEELARIKEKCVVYE